MIGQLNWTERGICIIENFYPYQNQLRIVKIKDGSPQAKKQNFSRWWFWWDYEWQWQWSRFFWIRWWRWVVTLLFLEVLIKLALFTAKIQPVKRVPQKSDLFCLFFGVNVNNTHSPHLLPQWQPKYTTPMLNCQTITLVYWNWPWVSFFCTLDLLENDGIPKIWWCIESVESYLCDSLGLLGLVSKCIHLYIILF